MSERRPKRLTPGQRSLAALREDYPAKLPESYWKQREAERPWGRLNDEEWAEVWAVMQPLLAQPTAELEAKVRSKTDKAAYLSSYFSCFKEFGSIVTQNTVLNSVREREKYLKSVEAFRIATAAMIGPEVNGTGADEYDPYSHYKELLSYLDTYLIPLLRHQIEQNRERAKGMPSRSSAAKPERDLWMARLVMTWRDAGLDVTHNGLKAFILAAMRPHVPTTDSAASTFIKDKWLAGKIPEPPPHFYFK